MSFIGGLIFAYRFARTRSFFAVWLEHALYGDLIFTIGLGRFFFTGVANL
jgi:CAAX protease family protein